jgi:SEC-C motif-containing protein
MSNCYCGTDNTFEDCCGKYISGKDYPTTAEELMRARYSSYASGDVEFIANTQISEKGDEFDLEEAKRWSSESTWKGLTIKSAKEFEKDATVHFIANYEDLEGNDCRHQEISTFNKIDNKWFYSHGSIVGLDPIKRDTPKVGRNEACPCGSGKKYKKCHGA